MMQLADRKSNANWHVFETVVTDCREEGLVGGLDFTVNVSLRSTPIASSPSPARIENAVHASQATARFVAAINTEGKGMNNCGAQNPITALDGALSYTYLDAESFRGLPEFLQQGVLQGGHQAGGRRLGLYCHTGRRLAPGVGFEAGAAEKAVSLAAKNKQSRYHENDY